MGTLLRMVVALCIGIGALYAAQRMWLSAVSTEIAAQPQPPEWLTARPVVPAVKFDAEQVVTQMNGGMGPIDTSAGERAGVESAARRVDLINRAAQSAVPLPPSFPGLPR